MATELKLDVLVTKNSRQLSQLADEFDKAAAEAEASGKKIDRTFSGFIDQQIEGTKKELAQLRQEFAKTGDLKVAGDIGGLEKNLKALEKIKKSFGDAGQESGKTFGQKFRSGLGQAFGFGRKQEDGFGKELLGALLTPQGIAGAATVASAAGVTIGGALLTGIGLAGIGAGIAGQLHSPQVKAALDKFEFDVSSGYKEATKSFAGPTADAISILDSGFKRALPALQDTLTQLAPEVTAIASGASGFLTGVVTGLEHAAVASKPLLDDLSGFLPSFGRDIGHVFDTMAAHEKEAKEGLDLLEEGLHGLTVAASGTITVLSGIWDVAKWTSTEYQLKRTEESITHVNIDQAIAADAGERVAKAFGKEGDAAGGAAQGLQTLNTQLTTLIGNQLSVAQSKNSFKEGLLDLNNELDQGSRSLSDNSLAGLRNQDVFTGLIEKAEAAREKQIELAGGTNASKTAVDAANASYEQAITDLVNAGAKAGVARDALQKLAGQYDIKVVLAEEQINLSGLAQNVAPHDVNRKGGARAGGGPVMAGYTYTVDEYGREQFTPDVNGYITPAGSGSAAAAPQTLVVDLRLNGDTVRTLLINHARGQGFRTVDQLLPVGQAR